MALSCVPNAVILPALPGTEILKVDVDLVKNFTGAASSQLYYGHSSVEFADLDFCNVTVRYMHPDTNDSVHAEMWLPMTNYNGLIQNIGGGGWVAGRYSPTYSAMGGAIAEGYATGTTDGGLINADDMRPGLWALASEGNPDLYRLNDFGSTSLNELAILSKGVVESFYSAKAKYTYWNGCSQGGRQGMMLAQRYPEAYDGIHACAPAIYFNQLVASTFYPQQLMQTKHYFPYPCQFNEIVQEAIDFCDPLDGIVDGIIADPDACPFDPMSVVGKVFFCSDTGENTTVTEEAAQIAKSTWEGIRTEKDNRFLWFGPNIGSQLSGEVSRFTADIGPAMTSCNDNGTCIGAPLGLGEVFIQLFLESNTTWSYKSMTRPEFEAYFHEAIQRYDSILGTSDPDLSAFHQKGGKILGYHGKIIPTKATEHYYDNVRRHVSNVHEFYRLYEVPGLQHCSGGKGGQPYNTFDALRAWVENGTVPESLPHTYVDDNGTEQNRLLCPYPLKAQLKAPLSPNQLATEVPNTQPDNAPYRHIHDFFRTAGDFDTSTM